MGFVVRTRRGRFGVLLKCLLLLQSELSVRHSHRE